MQRRRWQGHRGNGRFRATKLVARIYAENIGVATTRGRARHSMDTEHNSPIQALIRQRRNLMASSLLLIFFKAAGVSFERVGFLGTELIIERPGVLYTGLWLVWFYFLIRYVQFLLEVGNLGIQEAVIEKISQYAKRKFKPEEIQSITGVAINLKVRFLGDWRWGLISETYQVERGDIVKDFKYSFGPIQAGAWGLMAFCAIAISSSKVTEYLLPILLALVTAIIGACAWIQPDLHPL